jgi:two-component system chemotaxis sensor kinase CheA
MAIRSERGRGTTIEIQVPVSVASMQSLLVEASGTVVAIPLHAIRQTIRVTDADVADAAGAGSIVHDGVVIPLLALERALQPTARLDRRRGAWPGVVIESGGRSVAVGVDRLLGTSDIVVRTLPPMTQVDAAISGASLDAEGNPQLVIDPAGLVLVAERLRGAQDDESETERVPVLVIDDSLTTRMLEKSILESAGFEVDVAVSGEEGLAKARARRYRAFICDVEMPGMDGYSFVRETRADPMLRDTPAILVTSLNSPEDRRRGEQAGARAYIAKGEFDQDMLLRTIRGLIGTT